MMYPPHVLRPGTSIRPDTRIRSDTSISLRHADSCDSRFASPSDTPIRRDNSIRPNTSIRATAHMFQHRDTFQHRDSCDTTILSAPRSARHTDSSETTIHSNTSIRATYRFVRNDDTFQHRDSCDTPIRSDMPVIQHAVGRGFIPGTYGPGQLGALAPEVCFLARQSSELSRDPFRALQTPALRRQRRALNPDRLPRRSNHAESLNCELSHIQQPGTMRRLAL